MSSLAENRFFNLGVNLLGIFFILYAVIGLFYSFLTRSLSLDPAPRASVNIIEKHPAKTDRPVEKESDYAAIFNRDIFGTEKIKTEPEPITSEVVLEDLEPTKLNLRLIGTVVGRAMSTRAIINDLDDKTQRLYMEGDSVQGAIIKKIMRKVVVLTIEGRDEILSTEDDVKAIGKNGSGYNKHSEANLITLSRSSIRESIRDMNRLMSDMKITSYMQSGRPAGFVVSEIADGSLVQAMGMKNGDIIQGVNGQPVTSPEDAMRLYNTLRSAPQIGVEIIRRGMKKQLNYNFRD